MTTQEEVSHWLAEVGASIAKEVNRLWPHELKPIYRGLALSEEVGEVNRAILKRRHALTTPDGKCRGLTAMEWLAQLREELVQTLAVILDIGHREGIDFAASIEILVGRLQQRRPDV